MVPRMIWTCPIQWCCLIFSFLAGNTFLGKFGQKTKIITLSWNLVAGLIRICRIQWCCSLFSFSTENAPLGKFGPNCQYCQFKVKLNIYTNSNMQNSMMLFIFFLFLTGNMLLGANLVQKVKIFSLSWNFVNTYCFS